MMLVGVLQALVWLCMASTLLAAMPVLVQEVRRPTARGLLTCMASSAFAFYLFSYQVLLYCPRPMPICGMKHWLACARKSSTPFLLHRHGRLAARPPCTCLLCIGHRQGVACPNSHPGCGLWKFAQG